MLEKARLRDTGVKLEVNEKILDTVTGLMNEIQQLVRKSKELQAEIVASGRVCVVTTFPFHQPTCRSNVFNQLILPVCSAPTANTSVDTGHIQY